MKQLTGTVKSTAMQNSVVVEVTRMWQHPVYQKRVKRTKRYLAHDDLGVKIGDSVLIQESRPLSKKKRWIIKKNLTS